MLAGMINKHEKWCQVCFWLDDKYVRWEDAYVQGDGTTWMLCDEHMGFILEMKKSATRDAIFEAWGEFIEAAVKLTVAMSRNWGVDKVTNHA